MTDYALNDRGSLDVVTENFYDTEIMRVFGGLSVGHAQTWKGLAALVPEPTPEQIVPCVFDERVAPAVAAAVAAHA